MRMTQGRARIVGWIVAAIAGLAALLWYFDQPAGQQAQWAAVVGFGVLWVLALDARAEIKALRRRVDELERGKR